MMPPERFIHEPGRQQWCHGPIDLHLQAEGEPEVMEAAFQRGWAEFEGMLTALVQELPLLRRSIRPEDINPLQGPVAKIMWQACHALAGHDDAGFITPMAAVAGAVSQRLLRHFELPGVRRAAINNGGDIALHLSPGASWSMGLVSDAQSAWWAGHDDVPIRPDARFVIHHSMPVRGVATSGWSGRSLSRGIADSVTVLAASAAGADAAATMIANRVNIEHPGVVRRPAHTVRDDSDLGEILVTCHVPALGVGEITTALGRGLAYAQGLVDRGLIHAALIACQNRYAACGLESYWEADIQGDLAA